MKKKILLWLGYVTFSLIVPIFIVNIKFPFTDLFEGKSTWYKVSIGLIIVFAMIFFFFRNRIVEYAKTFNRVDILRGSIMWLVYVTPFVIAFLLLKVTAGFTEEFTFVVGWWVVSYMIGGIFHTLIHKNKVEKFKEWVNE